MLSSPPEKFHVHVKVNRWIAQSAFISKWVNGTFRLINSSQMKNLDRVTSSMTTCDMSEIQMIWFTADSFPKNFLQTRVRCIGSLMVFYRSSLVNKYLIEVQAREALFRSILFRTNINPIMADFFISVLWKYVKIFGESPRTHEKAFFTLLKRKGDLKIVVPPNIVLGVDIGSVPDKPHAFMDYKIIVWWINVKYNLLS